MSTFDKVRYCTLISLFLIFTLQCDSTNNDSPELDLEPIETLTVDGVTISLFAERALQTGANQLYWKVEEAGESLDISTMSIMPMMDMGMMQHSTPYEQPTTFDLDERYLTNNAVFIMPSGEMGTWDISFEIETMNGRMIIGTMPIAVNSSWRLSNVKDQNDQMYFISWVEPFTPKSGQNELAFMVHKRETMMSFPATTDVEMVVYPYMDMGGGQGHSTPFTAPVATGNGMFTGDINYSMSGTWTTSVRLITASNDTLPEVVFEYSVLAQ